MHRPTSKYEKRRGQEKLEALLHEGLESGSLTEMTQRDWEEIRRKALAGLKTRKASKKRG